MLLERYGLDNSLDNFSYLRESSFINFFKEHLIDTPTCFSKTKSMRRKVNEIDVMKLNNYFMRDGKRWKFLKLLLTINHQLFNSSVLSNYKNNILTWKDVYILNNSLIITDKSYKQHLQFSKHNVNFKHKKNPLPTLDGFDPSSVYAVNPTDGKCYPEGSCYEYTENN